MIYDTDIMLILKKLDAFEENLKKLEDEIKTLKQQVAVPSVWPNDPTKVSYWRGKGGSIPCYFDNLSPEDKMKPMSISCPCTKCSPYSLSQGSLVDGGFSQQWQSLPLKTDYELEDK